MKPRLLIAAAGLIVVGAFAYTLMSARRPALTAVTWAGAYGRAQASALFFPYAQQTRIDLRIAQYDGGLDELRARVTSQDAGWDVVDMELPDAVSACRAGLLEKIDAASLPAGANGEPAASDFVPNAIGPCWVGSVVYSQVIAYVPSHFGAVVAPSSLGDFFDLARYPGFRALKSTTAKLNLELALLADGVRPADVYKVLSTDEGLTRAFAKLNTIRASIVWAERSSEAIAMLEDGRAAFATALNGDIFDAAQHGRKLGVIWDRQLYELDAFGIPKGSLRREMAMDFIRYATAAPQLARVAEWVPYGPARRSALAKVGTNPELGIAMRPFLPTEPAHFATAFAIDDAWWQAHGNAIAPRWRAWVGH
jgi:putative spermidine/putrescine transport system substrate-binding protein